jgi:endonuclease V-like protein UPF0215 family
MMKSQFRVLGIDDGPFTFSDEKVPVVGVVVRKGYIDAVLRTEVGVDGDDATSVLGRFVLDSGYRDQLEAVMLDGACLGGFNVVDIRELHEALEIPLITVTRDRPDMGKIRAALEKLGGTPKPGRRPIPDWRDRLERLETTRLVEVRTGHNPIYIGFAGIEEPEAKGIVTASTIRGAIPEPLRLAHLIARAMVTGRSKGNC